MRYGVRLALASSILICMGLEMLVLAVPQKKSCEGVRTCRLHSFLAWYFDKQSTPMCYTRIYTHAAMLLRDASLSRTRDCSHPCICKRPPPGRRPSTTPAPRSSSQSLVHPGRPAASIRYMECPYFWQLLSFFFFFFIIIISPF